MRIIRILSVILLSALLSSLIAFASDKKMTAKSELWFDGQSLADFASVAGQPDLECNSAYAINLNTGAVVFEKNSKKSVAPASTVKMMTAIVAYENIPDLDAMVVASEDAVRKAQGVTAAIKAGEEYSASDLLRALLIKGANDAALVLAEHVAGSQQDFVKLMNEKAKQIGADSTVFTNVTGFDDDNMVTTARDVGIIGQYLYYIDDLFKMSNERSYSSERFKTLVVNRNYLLSRSNETEYFRSDAAGMSAGGTENGGKCLVSTVTAKDGLVYLCVIMGAPEADDVYYEYTDIAAVFDFCKDNFSYQTVASTKDVMCEIPVNNAVDVDHFTLFPDSEIKMLLPNDLDYSKEIYLEKRLFKEEAEAPVNRMDVFGEVVVKYRDTVSVGRAKLVSDVSVDKSNILYIFNRIESVVTGTWFVVFSVTALVLFVIYFGLSVYYTYFRKNKYTGNRNIRRR